MAGTAFDVSSGYASAPGSNPAGADGQRQQQGSRYSRSQRWFVSCAGTRSAVKLGNALEPIRVGTKFETERDMLGLKVSMQ
jgi:hypothetical protein